MKILENVQMNILLYIHTNTHTLVLWMWLYLCIYFCGYIWTMTNLVIHIPIQTSSVSHSFLPQHLDQVFVSKVSQTHNWKQNHTQSISREWVIFNIFCNLFTVDWQALYGRRYRATPLTFEFRSMKSSTFPCSLPLKTIVKEWPDWIWVRYCNRKPPVQQVSS